MQITLFDLEKQYCKEWYKFKNRTQLGKLHSAINWRLAASFLPAKITLKNAPSWISNEAMIGFMFLSHYTGFSDRKLIDFFNMSYHMQFFCGISLKDDKMLTDNSLVSRIRTYIGEYCDLQNLQNQLITTWKPHMKDTSILLMDATCYESYVRYPTDVKLIWESTEWIFEYILSLSKELNIAKPRTKYKAVHTAYLIYSKLKRKTYKKRKKITNRLLKLLAKGIYELQGLFNRYEKARHDVQVFKKFKLIKEVYLQQQYHAQDSEATIRNRILSLSKAYVRPIVRGKENKLVEFGMKVHMLQVDGINIIEHHSFKSFNECKRLKISLLKHKQQFGECQMLSADKIYATNENRRYVTKNKVFTNFDPKGVNTLTKAEKALKTTLNVARSTRMEGAFGNTKNNYGLRKIKARTEKTEVVCLFFGVLTANAVNIAKRISNKKLALAG